MADNVNIDTGSGDIVGADEVGGVKYQRVKVILGADGSNDGDVSSANPMPVTNTYFSNLSTLAGAIHNEDSAFINGDPGIAAYGVRKDTAAAQGANSDWHPVLMDSNGKVWTNSQVTDLIGLTTAGIALPSASLPTVTPFRTVTVNQTGIGNAGDILFNNSGINATYSAIASGNLGFATLAASTCYVAFPMGGYNSASISIYQNTGATFTVNVYTRLYNSTAIGNNKLLQTLTVNSGGDGYQLLPSKVDTSDVDITTFPQVPTYQLILELVVASGTPTTGGFTISCVRSGASGGGGAGGTGGGSATEATQLLVKSAVEAMQGELEDHAVGNTPLGTMQRKTSLGTASAFTANANANEAILQAQTQAIYYTLDGSTATTSNGFLLAVGDGKRLPVAGGVAISVIEASSGAVAVLQYVK